MIIVKRKIEIGRDARQKRLSIAKANVVPIGPGKVPRVSRLMALAIRAEQMLESGEIGDITELARLGHISQPRASQILGMTMLAPDIQEVLLFLPRTTRGRCPVHEKMLRAISHERDWAKQREMWRTVVPVAGLGTDEPNPGAT